MPYKGFSRKYKYYTSW